MIGCSFCVFSFAFYTFLAPPLRVGAFVHLFGIFSGYRRPRFIFLSWKAVFDRSNQAAEQ